MEFVSSGSSTPPEIGSPMGNVPSLPHPVKGETFHQFFFLPTEIRLKIWHFALPPSRIIAAKAHRTSLFPTLPRVPRLVLILMHVCREAREEILGTFQLLRFPVRATQPQMFQGIDYCQVTPYSYRRIECWPANGNESQRFDLERRWESRGHHVVNIKEDVVFLGRWEMMDLHRVYRKDLIPALTVALSEVRYLSISMHSWRDYKSAWMKVLRCLEKLREVVFVREVLGYATLSGNFELVELGEVTTPDYGFSGEVWRMRIIKDLERETAEWPAWKMPNVEFKAITDTILSSQDEGVDICRRHKRLAEGVWWRPNSV